MCPAATAARSCATKRARSSRAARRRATSTRSTCRSPSAVARSSSAGPIAKRASAPRPASVRAAPASRQVAQRRAAATTPGGTPSAPRPSPRPERRALAPEFRRSLLVHSDCPLTRSREARKEALEESSEKVVLHEDDIQRALTRIAHEIAERDPDAHSLAIVGIHRRGAFLANRLHDL